MSATEKEVLTVPESPPSQNAESSISADTTTPSKQMPQNSYSPDNLDNTSLSISIDNSIAVSIFDVELPDIDQNARLDWSGKGLKALPSQKCAELCSSDRQIIALKISRNSLRSLDCTSLPLGKCVELDASQNEISQLRPLHPVAPTLIHLSLSDNRINSLVTLNKFTQLRHLDLSHNRIEHFPFLDQLCQLVSLNLSSNHLKAIPNLSALTSLAELSLHGNSIRSLETIHAFLPFRSLRFLDLGGNLLADLTHLHFLHGFPELESLTILGNICTSPMGCTFSYRPFVFSCVLAQLSVLDGSCLSEQEILKGEWLHAQGRARSFRPCTGMDAQLCAYLNQECPLVSAELQLIGDERMTKVIRKRREYNNRPDDGRDIKSASSSTASLKQSTDNQTQLLNGTALSTSPTQTSTTTATTPQQLNQTQPKSKAKSTTSATNTQSSSGTPVNSGGRQPPTTSRFSRAAQQQQKGALTPAGTAAIRRAFAGNSPVSAVINARRRHQPQLQRQQLPLRDGLQMPSANVDTATISTSSTASSSSPRSSSTVILSRSEAQPTSTTTNGFGQNSAPKRSTDTKGRQQPLSLDNASSAQSPLTSRIPTATSCSSASALSNSCKRSILLHQSRTRSKAFEKTDGGSTTALLDFTMEEENGNGDGSRIPVKKKSGGIRSVLSRKLRRSGVNQPPSAVTSTEFRIQSLQKRLDQLGGQNSMLTAINEDHVRTFQQLTAKIQQLGLELANQAKMQRTLCDLLVPTPVNLMYERRDNDVLVSWENTVPLLNTLVDYYDVSLNNQPTGRVMARQKRLLITDLNPEEELEVSLQAHVSKLDNARSVPSKLLLLSNSSGQWAEKSGKEEEQAKEEEGKENRSTELSANT